MKKFTFQKVILIVAMMFLLTSLSLADSHGDMMPEEFNQDPEFKAMVEKGELPPLEERIPSEPYVVEPVNKIGEYGGTAKTAIININSYGGDDHMMMDMWVGLVKPNPEATKIVPNLAKKVESSEDKTTWIIHLREGVKWSDGAPFTAEDIMFWYEDILLNKELTPSVGVAWKAANGEIVNVEKIDKYTVQFKFAQPKPYFLPELAIRFGMGNICKHYMKQFHPKYTSEKELEKKVEAANFDHWFELFEDKGSSAQGIPLNTELPTLGSYTMVKKTSSRRVYEKNPYFWKVDSEGNQLPYIDRIEADLVSDKEVYNGKIMSGEVDFAAYQTDIRNFPMFKKYEEKGNYRTILWDSGRGNEVIYFLALTHKDPVLREIFQDVRFRRALSLAINREDLNETIYFGKAEPRQYTVLERNKYFEPRFAEAYVEYKPERAKNLLNEMGLTDEDGDGWRERPDGEKLTFTIEYITGESAKAPNVQLVAEYWQDIGVNVNTKQVSGELIWQRGPANMLDCTVWHGSAETILFPQDNNFMLPIGTYAANINFMEWARWYLSNGKEGEKPEGEPGSTGAKVKQLLDWYKQVVTEPDAEKRKKIVKNILESQAENLWAIGTIGNAPHVVVANKDLKNVPENGLWGWETEWSCKNNPEQFFFEGGEN